MNEPTHTIVSEATQDRLARAEVEYETAKRAYLQAWLAYCHESYAREECATGGPD